MGVGFGGRGGGGRISISILSNHRSFPKPDPFSLGSRRCSRKIRLSGRMGKVALESLVWLLWIHCRILEEYTTLVKKDHPGEEQSVKSTKPPLQKRSVSGFEDPTKTQLPPYLVVWMLDEGYMGNYPTAKPPGSNIPNRGKVKKSSWSQPKTKNP